MIIQVSLYIFFARGKKMIKLKLKVPNLTISILYLYPFSLSGESASDTSSGGASGGSIILDGQTVSVSGTIQANGGDGTAGHGGGGGGGKSQILF